MKLYRNCILFILTLLFSISILNAQQNDYFLIGKQAPTFTLKAPTGKLVSLGDFKGKFVLVDFWASWCKPCRAENPNVVKVFNEYNNKNFTVLGVSLDDNKADWIRAIKNDKLTWTNVSDLKGWNTSVIPLYQFEGIPFNVLIDPSGKVIAASLRGELLELVLKTVLNPKKAN